MLYHCVILVPVKQTHLPVCKVCMICMIPRNIDFVITPVTSDVLFLCVMTERYRAEWGDEVVQSCNWAGATCAVVAASPLIGKVAQLSYERTLGTFTGGLLGFLVRS